jgi:hypothetical protein
MAPSSKGGLAVMCMASRALTLRAKQICHHIAATLLKNNIEISIMIYFSILYCLSKNGWWLIIFVNYIRFSLQCYMGYKIFNDQSFNDKF